MEHARLNVRLALSLRVQIISRSMLTLVLIAAHVQLSVLQELSPRVRHSNFIHRQFQKNTKKTLRNLSKDMPCLFCMPDSFLLVSQTKRAMIDGTSFDKGVSDHELQRIRAIKEGDKG